MKEIAFFGGMWLLGTLVLGVVFLQGTPDSYYRGREELCATFSFILAALISAAMCACMWGCQ